MTEEPEVGRALTLLRDLEWNHLDACPVCGRQRCDGHAPGCRMAAVLMWRGIEEQVIKAAVAWSETGGLANCRALDAAVQVLHAAEAAENPR